jgi:hypothetical protein
MNLLEEAFKWADQLNGRDIVMFLGDTGAGKSTSINYYLGHQLRKERSYGRLSVRLKDEGLNEDSYAAIGQSIGASETTFVKGYSLKNHENKYWKLMLCDFPGFNDTRGELHDLTTTLSIDYAIAKAHSVKCIVLTFPYEDFWSSRCRLVIALFERLQDKLPKIFISKGSDDKEYNDLLDSLYLLITKYNSVEPFQENFRKAVNDALATEKKVLADSEQLQKQSGYRDEFAEMLSVKKIEIWKFLLGMINRGKVICLDERIPPLRDVNNFINSPGINKQLFSKAMNDDRVQQAFSKYISIEIDTWSKHIFQRYQQEFPAKIKKCR